IDAATGSHLWAEKYDGAMEDLFDLQDRITEGISGAIEPSMRQAEIERARRKRPDNLDAYDLYLRALPHTWAYTPAESEKAIELLNRALEIDPAFIAAHGLVAWCYQVVLVAGASPTLALSDSRRVKSVRHARAVLGPDTDDPLALAFAAFILAFFERDHDVALHAADPASAVPP